MMQRFGMKQSWYNRKTILVLEATEENHEKRRTVGAPADKQTGHFRNIEFTKKNCGVSIAKI
jgi:hypothetical protein